MSKILMFDLAFLVIFCIGVTLFLYKNRKNLNREGWIYFYKTKWGMQKIENFAKKNPSLLSGLKYPVIIVAFFLLIIIVSLLSLNAWGYIKDSERLIEATNGAPPVAPLIPYFPKLFGMESFFPDFYFSYFLIALLIVAVAHEFAHGIFMRRFKVKIKSTGFIFLGPILGAFVEQDQKTFEKAKNSEQMAILGAGVFVNTLLAILFFFSLILFFNLSYAPSGYIFAGYATTIINTSSIQGFQDYSEDLVYVESIEGIFLVEKELYQRLIANQSLMENHFLRVYLDSPAIKSDLQGIIIQLNGEKISNAENFRQDITSKSPNQSVEIMTLIDGEQFIYNVTLMENPFNSSVGFLGIVGVQRPQPRNFVGKIFNLIQYRDPSTFYQARYNQDVADYFRYLFYWIALINFFVAIFNMLPFGILDGGRFTYLFFLSITKSEKKSQKIYKIISSTVLLIFILILVGWFFARFLK